MASLKEIFNLEGHEDRAWHVAWSPSGDMIASCSGDHTVRIWSKSLDSNSETIWKCSATLEGGHSRTVRSCSWSPNGTMLATAGFDRLVCLWELDGGIWEQVAVLEGHESEVKSAEWSPNGMLIATCGRDKTVWVWEAAPGHEYEVIDVKHGHSQDVKRVAWHPTSELFLSASYDDSIKVWRECDDEWICIQTLSGDLVGGHTSTVWDLAFEPSTQGSRFASCSDDKTVKIWGIQSPTSYDDEPRVSILSTISGYHPRTIYSVDWSPSGFLATACADNAIRIFQIEDLDHNIADTSLRKPNCSLICQIDQAHNPVEVNCIRWHPKDPTLLASAGDDGHIKLWRFVAPS